MKKGDINTTIQWKSALRGGAGGGIGHQNISVRFDYGLNENNLASFYLAESDDPLFRKINNEIFQNYPLSIFIVGLPRCGSTLVESIISLNSNVKDLGEVNIFEESFRQYKQSESKKEKS